MSKLRLVKVVVQPTFVVDGGESLREIQVQPTTVGAEDWPGYAEGQFAEQARKLEEQLAAEPVS